MTLEMYVVNTSLACDHRLYAGGQWVNDTRQRCPECNAFIEDTEPSTIEIELNHLGKHGFVEFLWNSHALPLFRQDLLRLWQRSVITNLHGKPVNIVGWYGKSNKALPEKMPTYQRLITTSTVQLTEPLPQGVCATCGFVSYSFPDIGHIDKGLKIDEDSWDGSEFCRLKGYDFLFCTRHVVEITLKEGYTKHLVFVKAEKWEQWEEFDIRKWTPQKYSEYLETFLIRRLEDL